MVVGFCKIKLAFVAANALEASSKASPITRLFETVANFIAGPFSFPKLRREAVGAARFATRVGKHLCFPRNRIKYCRRGCADKLAPTSHELVLPRWGFSHLGRQTECERIPRPRKIFGSI